MDRSLFYFNCYYRRQLPAKMQATNSLILKAVAEAQKSVISCPPKAPEPEAKPIPELFTRKYREKRSNPTVVAVTIDNPSAISHEIDTTDVRHRIGNKISPIQMESSSEMTNMSLAEDSGEPMESSDSPVQTRVVQTRFIVTLDGAQPEITRCFDETSNDYDETELAELNDAEHTPVKSRLFRRRSTG